MSWAASHGWDLILLTAGDFDDCQWASGFWSWWQVRLLLTIKHPLGWLTSLTKIIRSLIWLQIFCHPINPLVETNMLQLKRALHISCNKLMCNYEQNRKFFIFAKISIWSKCLRLEWYSDWPQSIVESDPFALCPLPPLHLLQPHPFEAKSDFLRKKVKSEKF